MRITLAARASALALSAPAVDSPIGALALPGCARVVQLVQWS